MQLFMLNRKEKLKFLDLAMHMASIDGSLSAREERLLKVFAAEVGEAVSQEYTFKLSQDFDETLAFFADKEDWVKNLVYLNLLFLTMSGEDYNVEEHFLLENIQKTFKINDAKKQELLYIVFSYRDLQDKINKAVHDV